jgi:hypothetical protein
MAHSLLTPTVITRESLRILHQKLNFIGTIERQYDSRFAKSGAKIGETLQIRLPNEFTVRTGKSIQVQSITETKVDLTVATQKGVDWEFDSSDLTMTIDDYSKRYLDPAMSVLAANIEYDAMSMYKDVYQEVVDVGADITLAFVLQAAKRLTDSLAPVSGRTLNLNTTDNADLVDALKALFNDPAKVSKQYREGMVANDFMGFSQVYQNTLWPIHTTGTDDGTGDYLVNDAGTIAEGVTSITVDTGAGTWKKGDIFTFDSVNRVHPETKASSGVPMRFVVTADAGTSATTINFSPALYSSGAKQNVSAMPANNAKLNKIESDGSTGIGNAADYGISLGYHKEAFAIAFADLVMPKGVHMAAREVFDGISMRFVADFDINNDSFPARFDVLYGYKTIRPQLAVRLGFN